MPASCLRPSEIQMLKSSMNCLIAKEKITFWSYYATLPNSNYNDDHELTKQIPFYFLPTGPKIFPINPSGNANDWNFRE